MPIYKHHKATCCVWDSLVWVCGVSVQQVALWCLYIGIVCVCVCVCCVWDSLVWVWRSECAAGGFVLFVYRHCVAVSRGNYMSPVLRIIHLYEMNVYWDICYLRYHL